MPLFDYRCQLCAYEFEALQGINDAPLTDCPQCEHPGLRKKISAPAFTFKGSGWYKDLYGNPAPKQESTDKATSVPVAGAGQSDGSAPAPAETKPAAKSEPAPASTT